jgi:hypothetical protein
MAALVSIIPTRHPGSLVSREVMAVINCVGLPMSRCRPANLATLHRNTAPGSRMPAIGVATRSDVRPDAQSILAIPNSTVMQASGAQRIEANPASENAWVRHVNDVADSTLYPLANSWYVGANIPGKPRVHAICRRRAPLQEALR